MKKISSIFITFLFTLIFTINYVFLMNSHPLSRIRYDSEFDKYVIPRDMSTNEAKLDILDLIKFIIEQPYYYNKYYEEAIKSDIERIRDKMNEDGLRRKKFAVAYGELKSLIEFVEKQFPY